MRYIYTYLIFLTTLGPLSGQNLVLNPCFDQGECVQVNEIRTEFHQSYWMQWKLRPMTWGFENHRPDNSWYSAHFPDICNVFNETYYRPYHREVMEPVCGDFFGYSGLVFSNIYIAERNEFFQSYLGELNAELEEDSIYYFSAFFTNQVGRTRTTDNIQVVLLNDTVDIGYKTFINPDLISEKNIIYKRDSGDYIISFGEWSQWESCFQANGGEKFIRFLGGLPHGIDSLYRIPEDEFMEQSGAIPYLRPIGSRDMDNLVGYIDAVKIEKLPSRIPPVSLSFCANSCRQLSLNQVPDDPRFRTADSIRWADGVEGLYRTFPDSGSYVVSLYAACGETKVSFEVALEDCVVDTVEYSLDFCASDCYKLVAGAAYDSLFSQAESVRWADGEERIYRQFPDTGRYQGELILECVEVPIVVEVRSVVCRPLPDVWSIELCADDAQISDDSLPVSLQEWQADRWEWDTGERLSARRFVQSGRYELMGMRPCASALIDVDITLEDCDARIYIPNIFSPNGDGINDEWVYVAENIFFLEVEVYDRQGSRVFFSRTAGEYWGGFRDRGRFRAQPGVYVYRFEYRDREGSTKKKTGTVTLVR